MNLCSKHCEAACSSCIHTKHIEEGLVCAKHGVLTTSEHVCDDFTCYTLRTLRRCPSCGNTNIKILNAFTLMTEVDAYGQAVFPDQIHCGHIKVEQNYVCFDCEHTWQRVADDNRSLDGFLKHDWKTGRDKLWGNSRVLEKCHSSVEDTLETSCPNCGTGVTILEFIDENDIHASRNVNGLSILWRVSGESTVAKEAIVAGCGEGECYCTSCKHVW